MDRRLHKDRERIVDEVFSVERQCVYIKGPDSARSWTLAHLRKKKGKTAKDMYISRVILNI